jgi:hypothetical protein
MGKKTKQNKDTDTHTHTHKNQVQWLKPTILSYSVGGDWEDGRFRASLGEKNSISTMIAPAIAAMHEAKQEDQE